MLKKLITVFINRKASSLAKAVNTDIPYFRMKYAIVSSFLVVTGLLIPATSYAEDVVQTCTTTTQYNGAVTYVCGAHTPVETGIADSLPLIGSLSLGASGILLYLSNRAKKLE